MMNSDMSNNRKMQEYNLANIPAIPVENGAKWSLFRVGGLTNGEQRPVKTTFLGSGSDGMWISRASVARWVLEEATQAKFVGEIPYICN